MSRPIIVHFPCLVPEALAPGAPSAPGANVPDASALLLEPGLRKDPGPAFLVPEGLPMDHRQARGWLAQSMEYVDRFTHRGDLSAASAAGPDDFYSGSSQDIQSRLRAMEGEGGGSSVGEDPVVPARRRAQMVLLLAVGLEERVAELKALDDRLNESWRGMAESLGLEEDDDERLPHIMDVVPAPDAGPLASRLEEFGLSWPLLLESVLCFLPEDAALLVGDPSLIAAWRDMGLDLTPMAEPPQGLENALSGRAPGHRWSGRDRVPEDRPWLASERTVICVAAPEAS